MVELVTYIVEQLVDDKSAVNVTSAEENGVEVVTIRVAENDIGKVIGKQGKIAMAIRTLAKAVGIKKRQKIQYRYSRLNYLPQASSCGNYYMSEF